MITPKETSVILLQEEARVIQRRYTDEELNMLQKMWKMRQNVTKCDDVDDESVFLDDESDQADFDGPLQMPIHNITYTNSCEH